MEMSRPAGSGCVKRKQKPRDGTGHPPNRQALLHSPFPSREPQPALPSRSPFEPHLLCPMGLSPQPALTAFCLLVVISSKLQLSEFFMPFRLESERRE